ncbi:U3 small nucleolar RNA-associated protein 14 homolog A [Xenentodon cancila]
MVKPETRTKLSSERQNRNSAVTEEDGDEEKEVSDREEEEEEDGEEERRRRRLLEAISGLGGRRRRLAERSEAAVHVSEFMVSAEGEADRVQLSDLVGFGRDSAAVSAQTRRQLQKLQHGEKTVDSPLSARETERIQRGVAFDKAAATVSRWSSVIIRNQRSEQLVFPLNQDPAGPRPVEQLVAGWTAKTPLEQEVFALLTANKQPIRDPVLTSTDEAAVRAMSLEEARVHRAELQKNRALQSYYESRARRQRRIKSKQFHRVQNKAKKRQALKNFEELVQTDPGAALEELQGLERARIQERMSLKHQNSGKWARSRAIVAKYDLKARRAMQEQLEVHRDLTKKVGTSLEEEDEPVEEVEPEALPDFINDAEPSGQDSTNPWMRGRLTEEPSEGRHYTAEQGEEPNKAGEGNEFEGEEPNKAGEENEFEGEEPGDGEEEPEDALLREFDSRRKMQEEEEGMEMEDRRAGAKNKRGMASEKEEESNKDTAPHLQESFFRISTLEDVELLPLEPATSEAHEEPSQTRPTAENLPTIKSKKRKRGIELKEVLTKDTKAVSVPLAPTVTDDNNESEEPPDQRMLIREAFAGDDVVSDFLQDKRKQEEASKPKVADLTLPGWGEWGGGGLQPSKKKRRRFRVKRSPPPPRKDRQLPDVIISEKRNSAVSIHQVSSLPFPFEGPAQFESAIRLPLGRTWNTERTVKKVTKPRVLTQLGAIIEPMAKEELAKDARKVGAPASAAKH